MKSTILSTIEISDFEYDAFQKNAKKKSVARNEILLSPGKTCDKLFFLDKGLLRGYRLIDGQEYTHHFFVEKWFATDFKSYLSNEPGDLYIQALTDSDLYEFNKKTFQGLFKQHQEFEKLGRIIAESAYLKLVERLVDFQTINLKNRYHKLINNQPYLFEKVPQKYIASYLGVAEQSLSRIKSSM